MFSYFGAYTLFFLEAFRVSEPSSGQSGLSHCVRGWSEVWEEDTGLVWEPVLALAADLSDGQHLREQRYIRHQARCWKKHRLKSDLLLQ